MVCLDLDPNPNDLFGSHKMVRIPTDSDPQRCMIWSDFKLIICTVKNSWNESDLIRLSFISSQAAKAVVCVSII